MLKNVENEQKLLEHYYKYIKKLMKIISIIENQENFLFETFQVKILN